MIEAGSSGIKLSEAVQLEAEMVSGSPFLLDAVRLCNVEQAFGDHGDHEVPCRKNSEGPISMPRLYGGLPVVNCQCVLSVHGHSDSRALTSSKASKRRERSEQ